MSREPQPAVVRAPICGYCHVECTRTGSAMGLIEFKCLNEKCRHENLIKVRNPFPSPRRAADEQQQFDARA